MSREEDDAVALVRVYCGLASADPAEPQSSSEIWLTVAVVDDAGRLIDICEVSDDAGGYAELSALLAQRSGGQSAVAVAAESDDHVVTQLLTAAGRNLAFTDDDSADDYAERFADDESPEEIQSNAAERRAVGLARALQAGVLSAVGQSPPRDMLPLKPVLAAHAAVVAGRQSAAATLREVLRELYPAALRAYPDPAETIPLAVLDALPEPGILGGGAAGRNRDAQVVTELAAAGVADATTLGEAITALRVAIAETPRRTGVNRALTTAVAETIRQSVAAVRACDAAAASLVGVLADKMSPSRPQPGRQRSPLTPVAPLRAAPPAPVSSPAAAGAMPTVGQDAPPTRSRVAARP
ncbi:transposase, partial [Dactylosporangium aurantiacum]|nr:transposase [Dactylosporangium aurantiacum]